MLLDSLLLIDIKWRLSHIRHKTEWWGIRRRCITAMGQKWSHGIYQNSQRGNDIYISILFFLSTQFFILFFFFFIFFGGINKYPCKNEKTMKKVVYNTQKICIFFFRYEKLKFLAFTVDSKTGLKISFKDSTLKDQIWNLLSALRKKMWVIRFWLTKSKLVVIFRTKVCYIFFSGKSVYLHHHNNSNI